MKTNILNVRLGADYLEFSPDYVRKLCQKGVIKKAFKIGTDWFFPFSSIKNIKRQRKPRTTHSIQPK